MSCVQKNVIVVMMCNYFYAMFSICMTMILNRYGRSW